MLDAQATFDHLDDLGEWSATERKAIERARALVPALRERAGRAETLRRIPDETHADFRAAGFYRVLQPARFGGLEARYGLHTALAAEVAKACPSSGWALCVTACHAWIFGMYPLQAQEEVWGVNPDAAVASSFLPIAPKVMAEPGGLRLSGRWRFSSNVDHCDGAMLLVMAPSEGGPPRQLFAYLPRADYEIEDVWDVVALRASGSNDVVVKDAFVPTHRLLDVMTTREGRPPGAAANPGPLYTMPLFAAFSHSLCGAALGAAQGALELIMDELGGKTSVANVKLKEQQSVQLRIAEAAAEINSAAALIAMDRARLNAAAQARRLPDYRQRVTYRLNVGYAVKQCVSAVERLLPVVGGRGLESGHPVQRAWRDVHGVAQHIALVWDVQALNYGAVVFGGNAMDPRI